MPIQTASVEFKIDREMFVAEVKTPDGSVEIRTLRDSQKFYDTEHLGVYTAHPEAKLKKVSAKKNKRASMSQEREIMEALGGRRQAGSGALGHLKGDGRVRDKYRVEIKYTRTKSYRLDRDELSKIRGECSGLEQPLFVIDFVDKETGGSEDRWVLVPFHQFQKLDKQLK